MRRLASRSRPRLMAICALTLWAAVAAAAPSASGHLILANGTWSFRYFTKADDSSAIANCNNGTGSVDPVTVVAYQYGEYQRIFGHLDDETHFYNGPNGSGQVLCGTNDGSGYFTQPFWNAEIGHGFELLQAHFRIWYAPHGHELVEKFSLLTPHHERVGTNGTHNIDEDWEKWENHIQAEMNYHHNTYSDVYYRYPAGLWRGYWQNGYMTRIGGLHDGKY